MRMAEKEHTHRHRMEMAGLGSALLITLAIVVVSWDLINNGYDIAGFGLILTALVALVGAFIKVSGGLPKRDRD